MATLDDIRERHWPGPTQGLDPRCGNCGEAWPCDTAQVLAAHDRLARTLEDIAGDPRVSGPDEVWRDALAHMEDEDDG